jgi:hypothetical protein
LFSIALFDFGGRLSMGTSGFGIGCPQSLLLVAAMMIALVLTNEMDRGIDRRLINLSLIQGSLPT